MNKTYESLRGGDPLELLSYKLASKINLVKPSMRVYKIYNIKGLKMKPLLKSYDNRVSEELKALLKDNNLFKKDLKLKAINRRTYGQTSFTWYECEIQGEKYSTFDPVQGKCKKIDKDTLMLLSLKSHLKSLAIVG